MRTKLILIIITILAAAPLALPAQSYAAFPLGITAKTQDLVADNNGNLHLVWVTSTNEIRYGRIVPDGSGGFTVTGQRLVVAASAKAVQWTRPRMAVRPDGSTVHVVFLESDTQVRHSWRNSSGVWTTEYIRNGTKNYAFPSVGVNANGTVHFVAQKWPGPIVYAKKTVGGSWTTTDIALSDTAVEYRDCAMFTDQAGGVHATWHAGNRDGFYRYAPQGTDLSAVNTMTIPRRSGVSTNSFGDLFVRSDGQVHTAFATWGTEQATIDHSFRNSGGSFQVPTNASGGTIDNDDRDCWPAVAADTLRVYTAWAESYNGTVFTQVKLAVKEAGNWTRYDVDPTAAVYSNSKPVMAITGAGVFGVWRSNMFASGQLALGVLAADPSITVTAPDGGESWPATTARSVTWTTTGLMASVNIDYSTNGGGEWTRIVSGTANDGQYAWTVPDVLSSDCRVRVSDGDGDPSDASDASFAITAAPAETVSTPAVPGGPSAGGPGVSYTFTAGGAASSLGHDVQYKFSWGDGSESQWLATGTTQAAHSWAAAGTYAVNAKARCATHTDVESAWSAAKSVSITATPKIVVTAPALGDLWEKKLTYAITWDRPGEQNANVKIKLFNSAGTLVLTLSASTANDGAFNWLVPSTLATGKYFIRIQTLDNLLRDDSDIFQVIIPKITVTAPTATSVWLKGTSETITWTRIGTMDANVKIHLYLGTVKKLDITTGTANDGSFGWAIPATLAAGKYTVRVITLDGKVTGKSAEFKIANGRITVT
ncbi:MAG: GPI anchored serine-threonine rich family protein, partial [Candidatus Edwardsbacteria bacterium]|nr:GPI anchored serine-threonine rich family protein [Candidatus Edwardsbacteria bacterium]